MGDDQSARGRGDADELYDAGNLGRIVRALPDGLQQEFAEIWQRILVTEGEILIEEGAEPTETGYVVDGLLGMVKELPDGRRHIIGLLAPTDIYGRAFSGPMGFRVEALADSTVQVCDSSRLEDFLSRSPMAEQIFLANLLDEIDAAREWMAVLSSPKIVQRVACFLVIMCRRRLHDRDATETAKDGDVVNLDITVRRTDLAQYLGARPESLSRAFHELEDDGIIRINDPYNFDLLDIAKLLEVADHDLTIDDPR